MGCAGFARGAGACEISWSELTAGLMDTDGIAQPWRDSGSPVVSMCSRPFNGHPRGLFLATNGGGLVTDTQSDSCDGTARCTDTCAPLRFVRSRAWRLFAKSAYLHQYAQFGMENPRASFLEAFAAVDQTIHSYAQLIAS